LGERRLSYAGHLENKGNSDVCKTVESWICDDNGTKGRISGGTWVLLAAVYESKDVPTPGDFEERIV
jgi:hypothetical protein